VLRYAQLPINNDTTGDSLFLSFFLSQFFSVFRFLSLRFLTSTDVERSRNINKLVSYAVGACGSHYL
jgi:hypothetical protein